MNVTCDDRERIFEDGTEAEWTALESHASSCPLCAKEIRAWKSLSAAAQELRDYGDSPALWPRIERALAEQAARDSKPSQWRNWFAFLSGLSITWQTAAAAAFALLLTVSVSWVYIHKNPGPGVADKSLLRSDALKEVENAEATYEKAIDKLAAQAKPQLDEPATPLLASYHEKLLVLDSAIAELRAQAGLNPSNAQLRYQLLAMYQEKQKTLEEVLEAKQE